uniref:Ras family protein n=1 Tax=Angiostrongylus cantonensis TaxID=6313 RepID=A0A158PAM8_ANGCA
MSRYRSVVDPQSFTEISAHWFPEVIRGNPVAQVLLVGTQVDLRWQTSKHTVSTAKGRQLASQIGAEFFECSALTQHNLKQMFDSAILAALEGRRTIKSSRPQLHNSNYSLLDAKKMKPAVHFKESQDICLAVHIVYYKMIDKVQTNKAAINIIGSLSSQFIL